MGSFRRYYPIHHFHLCMYTVYPIYLQLVMMYRCINARRIKRGGGPVRYTGWTVPAYNQSQQQYGYTSDQNAYNMNNYPQGQYPPGQNPPAQQGQYSYQAPQQVGNDGAVYYDATQTEAQGIVQVVLRD